MNLTEMSPSNEFAMRVSVVIPTFKASRFIRETLASVLAQTQLPVEVIVVDDCSPDDTVPVVEQVAASAAIPVRVIRLPKNSGGPARPLNVGIAAAQGEFIAPLDHDDHWFPDRIAQQLKAFELCPDIGLVFGDVDVVISGRLETIEQEKADRYLEPILRASTAVAPDLFRIPSRVAYNSLVDYHGIARTCSNLLFPKAVWQGVRGFDERYRSTCDLQLVHAISQRWDLAYLPRKTCRWYGSDMNLSRGTTANGIRDQECFQHLIAMNRRRLSVSSGTRLRELIFKHACEVGFEARNQGRYRVAAQAYWQGIRFGKPARELIFGLLKLPSHYILARFSR